MSSETVTKVATLEFDFATVVHGLDLASPRNRQAGISMDMSCPGGGTLAVNMRTRVVPAAADEDEEKNNSDRGSLNGDILFWGCDGEPYDEAADWEAAGGSGGLTLEELTAASGEAASAEADDLRVRIRELEDENFVLTDEIKAVQRKQEKGGKDGDKLRAINEEMLRNLEKVTREKNSMSMQLKEQSAARPAPMVRRGSGSAPAASPAADNGEMKKLKAELEEAQCLQQHLVQQNEQYEQQIHNMQAELDAAEKLGSICKQLEKDNSKLSAKNEILKDEVSDLRAR